MTTRKKKKPTAPQSNKVLDDILPMQIEPEEIFYLMREMTKAHDEHGEASWYTQVGILADRYPKDHVRVSCITRGCNASLR